MKTPQNFLFLVLVIPVAVVIFLLWLQVLQMVPILLRAGIFSWVPAGILALIVLAGIRRMISGVWI